MTEKFIISYFSSVIIIVLLTLNTCIDADETYRAKVEQVCPFHDFQPTCPPGHVIVITSALYGRMRVGKCISTDARPTCSGDVRPEVDRLCSGRTSCHVTVPHPDLHRRLPCGATLLSYLEVSYECMPVLTAVFNCTSSSSSNEVKPVSTNLTSGYLSSTVASVQGLGGKQCPWLVTATPGKGVQLSLIDFAGLPNTPTVVNSQPYRGSSGGGTSGGRRTDADAIVYSSREESSSPMCKVYATVRERQPHGPPKESLICSTGSRDATVKYSTVSSVVEVIMHVPGSSSADSSTPQFLLHFEETGCANLNPPSPDTYVQRSWSGHDSISTVMCNFSSVESELVCEGSVWKGTVKNCSTPDVSSSLNSPSKPFMTSMGMAISVMMGIIVGVVCGSIVLGLIILWKRHMRQQRHLYANNYRDVTDYADGHQFDVTCNGYAADGSIAVSDRPTFLQIVDEHGTPIAVYRTIRRPRVHSNSASGSPAMVTSFESTYSSRVDPITGDILTMRGTLPRSSSRASQGRGRINYSPQLQPQHILSGTAGGQGTLPRLGVATRVAMATAANHDLCQDCQSMTGGIPLRHTEPLQDFSPGTEPLSPRLLVKNNRTLRTFRSAKDVPVNGDFHENRYN